MSQRYNVEKKALNLAAFHKSFAGDDFYAPLWRRNIMTEVSLVFVLKMPFLSYDIK